MDKRLIYTVGAIVFVVFLIIGINQYRLYQTKQYSPEDTAEYINSDISIRVFYNRPSKKGREIFGELVPYGQWWRTGANEATTVELSGDIQLANGLVLKAGNYSLVTVPNPKEWEVIFNSNIPDWGTEYYPEFDVARVKGTLEKLPQTVEFFTIDFTEEDGEPRLTMAWDDTKITVPFKVL